MASAWSSTGPEPHGPFLATVHPRNSAVVAGSQVARWAAKSSGAMTPAWSAPSECRCGRASSALAACGTTPVAHAVRAASIRSSRVAPSDPASRRPRSTAAYAGLVMRVAVGRGCPSTSQKSAEVVQWPVNSSRTDATVVATRSTRG
jgi:hypothetical protein